jgi:hypothetical protein
MIKVLLIAADPQENRPLKLNQEFRRIYNNFPVNNDQFDVEMRLSTTYEDLRKVLLSYKPSIIHFSCHGVGENGLVLVDDNEKKEIIDTKTLADLLRICQEVSANIACVIFNACYGEFQAKEITQYVKYAIGMSDQIKDDHAISFAQAFYEALFLKQKIETAVDLGCNSIRRLMGNNSLARAEYDPAPDDIVVPNYIPIPDYELPKLIVNNDLEDIYKELIGLPKQDNVLTYKQWNELQTVLWTIDFDILKNVCRDTLRKDVQDIESRIVSLENLLDLKKLLLEQYPYHKDNHRITIADFASRLTVRDELSNIQRINIKDWLEKLSNEKKIDLQSLSQESELQVSSSETILNSYLLVSIVENTGLANKFSLEAELIFNYQEGDTDYQSTSITSQVEGINEIVPVEIESYISELISIAIEKLPANHNLTVELFVPFSYLGKTFDLCEIPIPSRRIKKKKPLGSQYQFTVRCLDRYEDKQLFSEHIKRWMGIKNFFSQVNPLITLEQKCDYLKSSERTLNWDSLCTKWQRDNFYAISIIDELPKNKDDEEEYFDSFLLSGVPISLWSRSSGIKSGFEDTNFSIQQKFKELLTIGYYKDLGKIFTRIYQLRQDAHNTGDLAKDYLGYHLGFICDRPDPIPSNLKERLKQRGLQGSN